METKKFVAFADHSKRVASGTLAEVAEKSKTYLLANPDASILIFDCVTSHQAEVDFRGTAEAVKKRLEKKCSESDQNEFNHDKKAGPGRPKLGVISKEVTLLPQHWAWLAEQPGGASVTLRKLVEVSMKKNASRDALRRSQEATYKFLLATAGDRENYEEVLRALYAQEITKFTKLMQPWPKDIRDHALQLVKAEA